MNFVRRRPGLARLVAALDAEDVALVPLVGERLGQVGQVLGRRGVVGPVILVDEQDPLARGCTGRRGAEDCAAARRGSCAGSIPIQPAVQAVPARGAAALGCPAARCVDASAVDSPFGVRLGLVGPVPGDRLGQARLEARSAAPSRRAPASSG